MIYIFSEIKILDLATNNYIFKLLYNFKLFILLYLSVLF